MCRTERSIRLILSPLRLTGVQVVQCGERWMFETRGGGGDS